MENRKSLTEALILERLKAGRVELPPLSFRLLRLGSGAEAGGGFDARVEATWGKNRQRFAVELRALSTPKAFQDVVNRVRAAALPKGCQPLILVPYLREEQLQALEREGISGVDLCGNGVVLVAGRFAVCRSGAPNQFPNSAPIRNIYQKNSSMVARVFLGCRRFEAVQAIQAEINRRNPLVVGWGKTPMCLATVSKALKGLEQDLMVGRDGGIRLLQGDKLLDSLADNSRAPAVRERTRFKVELAGRSVTEALREAAEESKLPVVATGVSSVGRYAVMQRGEMVSVYCPRIGPLAERLAGSATDRFPNLELVETEDEPVYFDAREADGFRWAAPVQTYLELMEGDKRDQETALQVRELILRQGREVGP